MASSASMSKRPANVPPAIYSSRQRKDTDRNGMCTHLTMTRLYTQDFRCAICLKPSSLGWLWRCTQDRELILEDQDAFNKAKLDAVCDMIPRSIMPRERSPAARASELSFLSELNEADLQSYTPRQLAEILAQRAHVLEVAKQESAVLSNSRPFSSTIAADITSAGIRSCQSTATVTKASKNPWVPLRDTECQFKCCHYCRPSLIDRSYLSLDEIANGGISPTAATGFGFHLQRRPVALVKHFKSISLRPGALVTTSSRARRQQRPTLERRDAFRHFSSADSRPALSTINSTNSRSPALSTPKPPRSPESRQGHRAAAPAQAQRRRTLPGAPKLELALHTPLPAQSPEELALISGPPTPMEKSEREGIFGSTPLDLQHGVAVTEEAVGLHVPDLNTQL